MKTNAMCLTGPTDRLRPPQMNSNNWIKMMNPTFVRAAAAAEGRRRDVGSLGMGRREGGNSGRRARAAALCFQSDDARRSEMRIWHYLPKSQPAQSIISLA